jgi:uncharacterized repeat protein (TIGR01451 family)
MRHALVAVITVAAAVLLAASAAPSEAAHQAGGKRCKYGFKYVVKTIHGHKRRVKVCKPKPKPKPQADLKLSLEATLEQVTAGNHVGYTVEVENEGPDTAFDVKVTVDLPAAGNEFFSYGGGESAQCSANSAAAGTTHVECFYPELRPESDPGEFFDQSYAYISTQVEPEHAGDVTASAKVVSSTHDPHPEDDAVSKPLHVLPGPALADLGVAVSSAPDPASIRGGFTETVSVTNTGPSEATDVLVSVLLPQGTVVSEPPLFFFSPAPLSISNCSPYGYGPSSTATVCFDAVRSGETRTATIELAPSIHSPPTLQTDAVVSSYTRDSNLSNNRTSLSTSLVPFQPLAGVDLAAALDQPESAVAGELFPLGFRLANLGLSEAHDVQIQVETTPAVESLGITIVDLSSGFGCAATESPAACTIEELPSDARLVGLIAAKASLAGTYTATLTMSSAEAPTPVTTTTTFEVKPSPARR